MATSKPILRNSKESTKTRRTSKKFDRTEDQFFETMPLAATPYTFRDDADDIHDGFTEDTVNDGTKMTAILTIILVGIIALALAVMFISALESMKGSTTVNAASTSSPLEL